MSDGDSWKSGRFCGSSLLIRDSGAVNATKEEPIREALLVLCSVRGFSIGHMRWKFSVGGVFVVVQWTRGMKFCS